MRFICLLSVAAVVLFAGCADPAPYTYHYKLGKTASLHDGYATAPPAAPTQVQAAIAADAHVFAHNVLEGFDGGGKGHEVSGCGVD